MTRGRKTLLEKRPRLIKQIPDLIAKGYPHEFACGQVGVSKGWFYLALQRGEIARMGIEAAKDSAKALKELNARERQFLDFFDAVYEAEGTFVDLCLAPVLERAKNYTCPYCKGKGERKLKNRNCVCEHCKGKGIIAGEWLPAMALLERRFPNQFGKRTRIDVSREAEKLDDKSGEREFSDLSREFIEITSRLNEDEEAGEGSPAD